MKIVLPFVDHRYGPNGGWYIAGYAEHGNPLDDRAFRDAFTPVKTFVCEHEAWAYAKGYVDGMNSAKENKR